MEVIFSYLEDQQMVLVKTKGIADAKSSNQMSQSISQFMRQYKARRCLIDHTELQMVAGKTLEIYQRPNEILKLGIPVTIRIAALILPIHAEHFSFLETVSFNRGIGYRTFFDREEAEKWLTEATN